MKICVYEARPDERADLERQAALHGVELTVTDAVPTLENADLAAGCAGVSTLGQGRLGAALLDAYYAQGVRYLSTRTVGYDHIDLDHARAIGLRVCNASYAPNGVADFTVMLMLMCLRQYKQALWRGQVNDFSLGGLQGREMKDLTVGIIGTGRIGVQVARNLSGFGCHLLAHDLRPNPAAKELVDYVDFDTLLAQSDIITLHMPLLDSNRHLINRETIAKMRRGDHQLLPGRDGGHRGLDRGHRDRQDRRPGHGHRRGRRGHHPRRPPGGHPAQPELVLSPPVPQCHHDPAHGLLHRRRRGQHGGLRHRRHLPDGRRRALPHGADKAGGLNFPLPRRKNGTAQRAVPFFDSGQVFSPGDVPSPAVPSWRKGSTGSPAWWALVCTLIYWAFSLE